MTEDEARARVIRAMCPAQVCRTCGEPSRRLTADRSAFDRQPALAAHIRERREAAGITSAEINGWFGYKEIAKNWERTDEHGARIPNLTEWPILKERLGLSDDFDDLVLGERRWTESTVDYVAAGSSLPPGERRLNYDRGDGATRQVYRIEASRKAPEVFTDCGHDDWRPGVWIDPFADD